MPKVLGTFARQVNCLFKVPLDPGWLSHAANLRDEKARAKRKCPIFDFQDPNRKQDQCGGQSTTTDSRSITILESNEWHCCEISSGGLAGADSIHAAACLPR